MEQEKKGHVDRPDKANNNNNKKNESSDGDEDKKKPAALEGVPKYICPERNL
jgi:hypothetical protein